MWEIVFAVDDAGIAVGKNRFDRFKKKHPQAFELLLTRAGILVKNLNAGYPPAEVLRRGWVHVEGGGVFALDPNEPPLRLYCCLDARSRRLVILTLGDKRRQNEDVQDARRWTAEITKG